MFAELAISLPALAGLAIADHITGTAWYQSNREDITMSNLDFTGWDDIDPTETVEFWELPEPSEEDIARALDIDGIDIDGYATEESTEVLVESVAWLHSLLYSDYADASDDDDRVAMDIPRSVIDRSAGALF